MRMPGRTKTTHVGSNQSTEQAQATKGAQPLISIIIVSYNVKDFLEQALLSVHKSLSNVKGEVIVVDNASTDGTVSFLRDRFPDVTLIENARNVGFATASNQGLREAGGQYLALLNPDTIVREDTFTSMIEFYRNNPETGMLGCKILNPNGSLQLACRRSFPTPWVAFTKLSGLSHLFPKSKWFGRYNLTYLDENQVCEVEAISGSFMMIRREVLENVGLLDESFFLYGEDLDWCYRIHEKGWKVQYFPRTQIIHFKGESSKHAQFDQLKVFYQAMTLFVEKHFKAKYFFMPYRLLLLAIWIRGAFSFAKKLFSAIAIPLIDFTLLSLSITFGVYWRFGALADWDSFTPIILAYGAITMMLLNHFGSYRKYQYSIAKAGFGVLAGFLVTATLLFFFKQYAYSRFVVLLGGGLSLIVVPGWRLILNLLSNSSWAPLKSTAGKMASERNTLIVGDSESSEALIRKFNRQIDKSYRIAGLVSTNGAKTGETYEGVAVCGNVDDLGRIIEENNIREVIFSTTKLSYDRILGLIAGLGRHDVNFKLAPSNLEVIIGKASIDRIDDVPLVDLEYKLHALHYRFVKRLFDLFLSVVLSVLTGPLCLAQLLFGKKLRKLEVRGYQSRAITLFEFQASEPGRMDKLPYLWSVVKGDLSLVGSEILETGKAEIPASKNEIELALKPGLTGLVQVNRRKNLGTKDKARYNSHYLANYSLLLDLEIIFKAIFRI